MRLLLVDQILFIVMAGLGALTSPFALADEMVSPVSVTIQMAQETFSSSDAVEGKVVLYNTAPSGLHAIFNVDVLLNGTSQQSFFISFKSLLTGRNVFSLKDFGVRLPAQAGQWRIVIKQQGLADDKAARADFVVESKDVVGKIF